MNPMVSTNQKPTDTQKLKRKEYKHTTKENYQTTREETERRKRQKGTTKAISIKGKKMAISIGLAKRFIRFFP